MPNQQMEFLTLFVKQSAQPSLLIDIKSRQLITNSYHCVDLFELDQNSTDIPKINGNSLYQNIANQAQQLISKGLSLIHI